VVVAVVALVVVDVQVAPVFELGVVVAFLA
jgi:hypothetical protein